MAIVRIPRAAVDASGGGDDMSTILSRLAPVGALTKTAGNLSGSPDLGAVGTGLAGLLGLTRGIVKGDPGQAIGGAANVGSGVAGLAGYPGISSGLGAIGGPLTFATGLASGDPLSSTLGGLQTGSLISGYLGGPTITSGLSALYGLLPGAAEGAFGGGALGAGSLAAGSASELGLGATAAAAGGAGSALAGGLALGPFALLAAGGLHALTSGGGDMFDALFGEDHTQPWSQMQEYKANADAWPGLVQQRVAGANLFKNLDQYDTPDEITQALGTAAQGRSAQTEPAFWTLSHVPTALPNLKPMDLSAWEAVSPELKGENWGAFLGLADKAQNAGLDWMPGVPGLGSGPLRRDEGMQAVGPLTDYQHQGLDVSTGADVGRQRTGWAPGQGNNSTTQEAWDVSQALGSMGTDLGIDWAKRGESGRDQGYEVAPDELASYGFTPGQYGTAALGYLKSLDTGITAGDKWTDYTKALGVTDEALAALPTGLGPFRSKVTMPYSAQLPELNLGGF